MNSSSEFIMLLKSILVAGIVGGVVIYFVLAVSYSKIFKANGEKGWKGYIPILNLCVLMKLVNMNLLCIFLLIVPILNLFVLALLSVKLANKFGRSAGFAIGLLFLPFIFYPILALSFKVEKTKKDKNEKVEESKLIVCPVCGTELNNGEKKCYVCDTEITDDSINKSIDNSSNLLENNELEDENIDNNDINDSEFKNELYQENSNINEQEYFENSNKISSDTLDENICENKDVYKIDNDILDTSKNENVNVKVYHNPLDTDFDDIFLRNRNEVKEKIDVKKDEEKFNDMVNKYNFNDNELTVTELGTIDIPKKEIINEEVKNVFESKSNSSPEKSDFKSSSRTLDEILRINQNLYTKNDNKNIVEDKQDNNISEDELIKKIELLNKKLEQSEAEVHKEKNKVKICKVCGTTIPAYSKTCLLCGSPVED